MNEPQKRISRRAPIDKVNVKELARAGHLSYPQIAQRLNLPLGTVQRYLSQLRREEAIPRRAPGPAPGRTSDG